MYSNTYLSLYENVLLVYVPAECMMVAVAGVQIF